MYLSFTAKELHRQSVKADGLKYFSKIGGEEKGTAEPNYFIYLKHTPGK